MLPTSVKPAFSPGSSPIFRPASPALRKPLVGLGITTYEARPLDAYERAARGKQKVNHLTLHPNAAVTIHIDEREVLSMMWRGFSKASTQAAKKSWLCQRLGSFHLRSYVRNVLAEGNTDAVKSQIGKVHMVLPGEAEGIKARPSHWPFSETSPHVPKGPPQAKDVSQAASVWAQLGSAIEKETRKVAPAEETRKTRNAESLVGSWIDRAEQYLSPGTQEAPLPKSTRERLEAQLDALRNRWAV